MRNPGRDPSLSGSLGPSLLSKTGFPGPVLGPKSPDLDFSLFSHSLTLLPPSSVSTAARLPQVSSPPCRLPPLLLATTLNCLEGSFNLQTFQFSGNQTSAFPADLNLIHESSIGRRSYSFIFCEERKREVCVFLHRNCLTRSVDSTQPRVVCVHLCWSQLCAGAPCPAVSCLSLCPALSKPLYPPASQVHRSTE